MQYYDRRRRKFRDVNGDRQTASIRRFHCVSCKRYHSEIPDFLVPYKRYSREAIEQVCLSDRALVPEEERSRQRLRTWYRSMTSHLRAVWQRLVKQLLLPREKAPTFQDLVKICVNSGFWVTTRSAVLATSL